MHVRIAHAIAGILVLFSLLLGIKINENWFWLTGFVGVNLLQNAFTNWCLMYVILENLGISDKKMCNT